MPVLAGHAAVHGTCWSTGQQAAGCIAVLSRG
jgi:hypothetical protein